MQHEGQQKRIRPPAVAGQFYPDDAAQLARYVQAALGEGLRAVPELGKVEAVIAPHAGYRFSGSIAARAFTALRQHGPVSRILLLGPAHTVPLRGIAAPAWNGFATPLGVVEVDADLREAVAGLPQVIVDDVPHAREHALEVELPFIQALYPGVPVLPLVVGETTPEEVAQVIEAARRLDPQTAIVVSSDLSHYEPYEQARAHDAATARKIAALDERHIGPRDACGARPLAGLLHEAKAHRWRPVLLDLRNSGDTAGDRERVVGYGAWAFVRQAA